MKLLKRFDPQVVVGTGGYVSGPVLLAARMKRIPVIIQEQNQSPGLTNRLLAPIASEIHVSFPETVDFPGAGKGKVFLTGNPIAFNGNGESTPPEMPREAPGEPPVLLIMGGSQGAHPINQLMVRYLNSLDPLPFRVFFQTGDKDRARTRSSLADRTPPPVIRAFFDDLGAIYRQTDLVICRAGAMTLSEIACWGIPSILIPYPHAAAGHQEKNARYFEREGAAIVVREDEADHRVVGDLIERVIGNLTIWKDMSRAAFRLRRPGARDVLVDRILALGR
jgi:UDP-N-acetylglucosamine--N-acetylmuramyl-(pentapeptide) pyrophosphoryl-undecaprenol N-acetylglucosamine transferase